MKTTMETTFEKLPAVEGSVACLTCGCGARSDLDMDRQAANRLREKDELLREAYNRFQQYEMDVDDHPPRDHIEFMKRLRAEIYA